MSSDVADFFVRWNMIYLTGASDGRTREQRVKIQELVKILELQAGQQVYVSESIFRDLDGNTRSGKVRAEALMKAFADPNCTHIFDVTGGDRTNDILPYLDENLIRANPKKFYGYSDLSVLLNYLAERGSMAYYFNPMTLLHLEVRKRYWEYFFGQEEVLLNPPVTMVRGTFPQVDIRGGNIRCSLKLAGTPYQPDYKGKILLLESLSGGLDRMLSYFEQYRQMGILNDCAGLLLGEFTQLEREGTYEDFMQICLSAEELQEKPFGVCKKIGHSINNYIISFMT